MKLSDEELRELRRRFGDDVPVTDRLPTPKDLAERESWLERIGSTIGLEKWMWKSRGGLLIAIIVVPPGVSGLVEFWEPPIKASIEYARPYISVVEETSLQLKDRIVAFLPEPESETTAKSQKMAMLVPTIDQLISTSPGRMYIDATVYRLSHLQVEALGGRGAASYGGRWNSPGFQVIYTSDSVLTAVEALRRATAPVLPTKSFVLHQIRIAGLAEVLPDIYLGGAEEETRRFGDDWLRRSETDILLAPSHIDPASHTIVINLARRDYFGLDLIQSTQLGLALPT